MAGLLFIVRWGSPTGPSSRQAPIGCPPLLYRTLFITY